MKYLPAPSRLVAALSILALALCLGCAKPAEEPPAAEPEPEPAAEPAPADSEEPDGEMVTIVEGTPLIWFVDTDEVAQLRSDMNDGKIPTSCNVLYDQSGSLPDVTVTDPETIKEIYALLQEVFVPEGGRSMSVTDSYHHVIFTLQDGTKAGFNFEGIHNLYLDGKNYSVIYDDALWMYVRQLQDELMTGGSTVEEGVYHITLEATDDTLVTSCPTSAKKGELVTIRTVGMADAELILKVDGIRLWASNNMGTEFHFEMPDRDVTVTVSCHVFPGGA